MASLAKVSRPVARLIGRAAVVQAVQSSAIPLTWVVAPAGSGKTGFGLEFCERCSGPTAWMRLDEGDADPASFLMYFQQAIVNGAVASDWQPPLLLREHLPALQIYLRLFVRSLALAIAPDACIVMDDAHRCQQAPFFRQFLEILIEELPRGVRQLVLSREPAPANCARLLAHGMMQEIPGTALAFSAAETEVLLHVIGVERAVEVCDTVFQLTQGWPAGIALIAALLKRRRQAVLKGDEMLSDAVAAYIAEEVFSAFGNVERDALLAVCWLPYFNGAWAVALSGAAGAGDAMARLAAQGALIYEYPGRQYTLHPIFRRFLRNWAESKIDAAQRMRWIRHCVSLLESDGNLDAAITLALDHGLPQLAAPLIEKHAETMFAAARHQTLAHWVDALPAQHRSPWHHYWLGMSIFMTDTARARASLLAAFEAFDAQSNRKYRFLALSAVISSYFFNGVAQEPLRDFLSRHVDLQRDVEQLPDPSLKAHLTHSVWSALFIAEPGHADLPLWEQRALDTLRQPVDPTLKIRLATMLAQHYGMSGRCHRMRSLRALLDALPEAASLPSYARYLSYLIQLYDDLFSLALERLDGTYTACCRYSEESGIRIMDSHYALIHALGLMFRGEFVKVNAVLAKVAAATSPTHHHLVGHLHLTQAWAANWQGDARAGLEHARLAREAGRRNGCVPYELSSLVTECISQALIDHEACRAQLEVLRQRGKEMNYSITTIHADLIEAWMMLDGDTPSPSAKEEVSQLVQRALSQLREESDGYLLFAIPQILQPLCAWALERGIETDMAGGLIRAFRLRPPQDAPRSWPWPVSIRCFGGFQLHIEGAPIRSQGKSKHRQLDLVRLLAAYAPAPMSLDHVAAALWPDSEGDSARHALETTLSRLRATIGPDVIRLDQGRLSFNNDMCWSDTSALSRQLSRLELLADRTDATAFELVEHAKRILELYRGEMLPGDDTSWALSPRTLWRNRITRMLGATARALIQRDSVAEANALLERAVEADRQCSALSTLLARLNC